MLKELTQDQSSLINLVSTFYLQPEYEQMHKKLENSIKTDSKQFKSLKSKLTKSKSRLDLKSR